LRLAIPPEKRVLLQSNRLRPAEGGRVKALVLNAPGRGFDFNDVDIAAPTGREVLADVQACGLCRTDQA
jgi:hypothetical protein